MSTEHPASLILASASPRRRELLDQVGVAYRVQSADVDESRHEGECAAAYVVRVAQLKAAAVMSGNSSLLPVLAADTAVVVDHEILGKPASREHAQRMLKSLSGRSHQVYSAVVLALDAQTRHHALNVSEVEFAVLPDDWIRAYCESGEPLDKAGAYAIQGRAAEQIKQLRGSYSGVMGLPLYETMQLLGAASISGPFGLNVK